jgi:hypothetical protein
MEVENEQPLKKQCMRAELSSETEKISEKLRALALDAKGAWAGFVDCMVALAKKVGGQNFKASLEDQDNQNEAAALVFRTVVPFLMGHVPKMAPEDETWKSVRAAVKKLTTTLNEMAKYILAYYVITGTKSVHYGEVEASPTFQDEMDELFQFGCEEEVSLLYMVEFMNFTMVMQQSIFKWHEKAEAAIFSRMRFSMPMVLDFIFGNDETLRRNFIETREAQVCKRNNERVRDFLVMYPAPADGGKAAWSDAFFDGFQQVAEFERDLAGYSDAWGKFCRTAIAASGGAVKNITAFNPSSLSTALCSETVTNVDVIGKLYDFFALKWNCFDSLGKAMTLTLLKEVRAAAMMAVIYCFLEFRLPGKVPMWVIEYIHRHESNDLKELREYIREIHGYHPSCSFAELNVPL